jgi:hypothetical protein
MTAAAALAVSHQTAFRQWTCLRAAFRQPDAGLVVAGRAVFLRVVAVLGAFPQAVVVQAAFHRAVADQAVFRPAVVV